MCRSATIIALCLATSGAVCAISADRSPQNPELFLARIRNEGAAAVVQSLWETTGWSDLTAHVSSGKPEWVDVAIAISPGTDAGATEELQDALFAGLGQNPTYELSVLPVDESDGSPLSLSTICSGRSDPLGTYAASIAELQRVETAVEKVSIKSLERRKRQCLAQLTMGEANLKRYFAVP